MSGDAAPGDLDVLRRLVNTLNVEGGEDDLSAAWLIDNELLGPGASLSERELVAARAVREALRALLLAHNGGGPVADAAAELDRQAESVALRAAFDATGTVRLVPGAPSGWPAALARILAIIARAQLDGTWPRLKACAADSCQWAYYDHSRNRSRTWCDMAVCGNREKARTFRARSR